MRSRIVWYWTAAALGAAVCSTPAIAQTGFGFRHNVSGPTAEQIRTAPIDFEDPEVAPFTGFEVGPLTVDPGLDGYRYTLPDGNFALLANCAPDQRCEQVAFMAPLGQMTEDQAYEIEDVLSELNYLDNPENEQIVPVVQNGGGGLVQTFVIDSRTPAAYVHSRYPVFLAGLSNLEDEGIISRPVRDSPLVAKWGSYAAAAQVGWWSDESGGFTRYSWIVPGEQLRIETFDRWGGAGTPNIYTVTGDTLTGQPTFGSLRFVSRTRLRSEFASGRVEEIDEDLYSKTITDNFAPYEWRATATRQPRFPDAATIARANGVNPCPGTRDELDRYLAGQRALSEDAEVPTVAAEGFVLGGYAGERRYDPRGMTYLGARPVSVKASIIEGKPFSLEVMLPGADPRSFEPLFRASFRTGVVRCSDYDDYGSCDWNSREDTWNAADGVLTTVGITRTIFSDTETRLLCSYR